MKRNHDGGPGPFIYIDFEGEADKPSKPEHERVQHPTLLGARMPNPEGGRPLYKVWLFEEVLSPMVKGRLPGHRVVCSLEEAILELIEIVQQHHGRLVYFSDHEQATVTRFAPHLAERFRQVSFNIKSGTDPIVRERLGPGSDLTLDNTVLALVPKRTFESPPEGGVAGACRLLRAAGQRTSRWGSWTEAEKECARQLLRYNRDDCRALHHLMNVVKLHKPAKIPAD